MNKILPHVRTLVENIKENIAISCLTIAASLYLAKKILFPIIKSKKNKCKQSQELPWLCSNFINFFKSKFRKNKNFQLCYLFINNLTTISNEEGYSDSEINDNINNKNPNEIKIKKTKKLIKKITLDYIKEDEKVKKTEDYNSKKDKIFYILLNNLSFLPAQHHSQPDEYASIALKIA